MPEFNPPGLYPADEGSSMVIGLNSLQCLPPEIKITIMSFLPDRKSLHSVLLSCKSFNETFEDSALPILLSVLLAEVPAAVLTEALWCWKALSATEQGQDAILAFLEAYDPKADPQTLLLNLPVAGAEVLDYIEIHQSVLYWTSRFFDNILSLRPLSGSEPCKQRECSVWERNRLQRSLYRYELCSILFQTKRAPGLPRDLLPIDHVYQIEYLFKKLHPVAAEQIRCIYDFLFWYTTDDFYAKCEHDIQFAESYVLPSNNEDITELHPRREYILARGLRYIRSIDKEITSVQRCSWIPDWGFESAFLGKTLKHVHELDLEDFAEDLDEEEEHGTCTWYIFQRVRNDWALYSYTERQNGYSPELRYLRSWGYCFWDADTLNALNLLHCPLEVSDRARKWANAKEQELSDADDRALASQRARNLLFSRGGRGWYDKGGESCIRWEYGGPELHYLPGEEPPGWSGRTLEDDEKAFSEKLKAEGIMMGNQK